MFHFIKAASLALFVVGCQQLPAQPTLGIYLGAGISTPQVTMAPDNPYPWSATSKTGAVFGLYTQIPVKNNWIFRPMVQIAGKGYTEKGTAGPYPYSYKAGLHYIDALLNFVHASQASGNGFLIGAGLAPSFLLGETYQSQLFKKVDMGANVLLGYQTPLGFSVNLTYTHGFLNAKEYHDQIKTFKNRFAAFTAGYLF